MRDQSDENLMLRYATGDMDAFEALYARYRVPLYCYFVRQTGNTSEANDLYQGVWEKIIAGRARFAAGTPFKAWAFRIAHNHLVDYLRRQRPTAPLEQAGFLGTPPGQEDSADREQRQKALRKALKALPEAQRATVMLRLEGGFGIDEIALMTGVGAETAKSRLRYATAKLKQVLGQ